jgi:hypothetical protein
MENLLLSGLDPGQKVDPLGRGVNQAIILDILSRSGRFFKLGMETKQFPVVHE